MVFIFSLTISLRLDLLDAIKTLDNAPASVHHHVKVHHEAHAKSKGGHKLKEANDSHSLQGKHGKTHGVC